MHWMKPSHAAGRALRSAVLLAAIAPSYGWAAFDPPFIVAVGHGAENPQVALDAEGDALMVWTCRDIQGNLRVQARARPAAGGLGPVQTLSAVGYSAIDPQIAVDADGDALIVWTRLASPQPASQIQLRTRSKTGALGPIQSIGTAAWSAHPRIALDADGDALIVWAHKVGEEPVHYAIRGRTRSAGGALGPILNLSADLHTGNPQVAVAANGDALVVWGQWVVSTAEQSIRARAVSADGVLGPILLLSQPGGRPRAHQVAIDSDGDALVVWERDRGSHPGIEARARSAAGALGPIVTLSSAGAHAYSPQLGFDADGDGLIVWSRQDAGGSSRIQARARSAAGVLGPVQTLTAGHDFDQQVAVDADGDAVVAWVHGTTRRIQARTRSAAGALGPIQTISFQGAYDPRVAVDPDGDAVAVWRRDAGSNDRIGAAVGP
jgi:hypothetical protein